MTETPFREFYEATPDAVVVIDQTGRIIFANSRVEAMLGYAPSDLIGKFQSVLLPERFRDRHSAHIDSFMKNPSPRMMGVGMGLTALGKDGSDCVVEISLSPYPTPQGLVVIAAMREMTPKEIKNDSLEHENANLRDLLGLARNDVTVLLRQAGIEAIERETGARFQRLLLEELHHRVKNMLATVTAITSQSLRNAKDVNQARSAIVSRLTAMGRAQDVLLRTAETGAHLGDVIREAIEPFESSADPRFVVQYVPIDIGPGAILPLTLSLNELGTNAVKYGALSNVAGRIAITIFIDEDTQLFTLRWMETGGPPVQQPAQYNFGTKLLGVLAAQLHGEIRLRYKPAGIDYQLKIPFALIGVIRADADAPCQP